MNLRRQKLKGFTLVEMIISVGIFATVMIVVIGSLLQVVSANSRSQAIKVVLDSVDFAIEDLTRNIKNGVSYECSDTGSTDCSSDPSSYFSVENNSRVKISYLLGRHPENNSVNAILKRTGTATRIAITPPEVNIEKLLFFLDGIDDPNDQPNVFLIVEGTVNYKKSLNARINVETFITQRSFIRN
jgi:prepilin-type N-terminal cleavage/methylation domain-containing protein